MATIDEFRRLLKKAGVVPYRRVGKIRIVHDRDLPVPTRTAAIEAVKTFAPALVNEWPEPTPEAMDEWDRHGMVVADVCDDPMPMGLDPRICEPDWVYRWIERYHFRLTRPAPDRLLGVAMDGWDMGKIRKLLPQWLIDLSQNRHQDLIHGLPLPSPG